MMGAGTYRDWAHELVAGVDDGLAKLLVLRALLAIGMITLTDAAHGDDYDDDDKGLSKLLFNRTKRGTASAPTSRLLQVKALILGIGTRETLVTR